MQLHEIRDDDPELLEILRGLPPKPIFTTADLNGSPFKLTKIYEEMGLGRLVADYAGQRPVFKPVNVAKWYLLLMREAAQSRKAERSEQARARQVKLWSRKRQIAAGANAA